MRLRRIPKALPELMDNPDLVIVNPTEKIDFQEVFGNDNPLHIEIGCGKGAFVVGMAKEYPNINFVAIEKFDSVLYKALLKVKESELPNIRLMLLDAEDLLEVFDEVDSIYLNFSDPWPKAKHEKRRLTYKKKLMKYEKILRGDLIFKTDNKDFFHYSVGEFLDYGMNLKHITYDLHSEDMFNVKTEFEERFSKLGHKINRIVVNFNEK